MNNTLGLLRKSALPTEVSRILPGLFLVAQNRGVGVGFARVRGQ